MVSHVILLSYDAFGERDWELAKTQPNLARLIENGAYTTKLRSVHPTLTYTVHTTMVTGVYPDKHGIFHNNPFQPFVPEKEREWFWHREAIQVPTIYDAMKKKGLTAAGLLWPVSGKSSLKYNMPEVHAIHKENQALKIMKNGSPLFCLGLELRHGKIRKGIEQPYLDDFTTACAIDTIKRKKPNLLLIHLLELDDAKHRYGTGSLEAKEAIIHMDRRIGELAKAIEETGLKDKTVLMVVGDHSQLDVRYKVRLNQILQKAGLIYEDKGQLQWRAYLQSTGGGAYLYFKEGDREAEEIALDTIANAMKEGCYGIERVISPQEMAELRVKTRAAYMIEAKEGYSFEDTLEGPIILDLASKGMKYATHGYLPDKENYGCNFLVVGPGIKKNFSFGPTEMVDIAPTIGRLLGVEFTHGDGRVLHEIFLD